MNGEAYWYKNGKAIEVNGYHIHDIMGNAKEFGTSREEIEALYKKYNEHLGQEGKARDEIMNKVIENGWIRVRQYITRNGNSWSINFNSFTRQKKDIQNLIAYLMLDKKKMKNVDTVALSSVDGKFQQSYSGYMDEKDGIISLLEGKEEKIKLVDKYDYFGY